MRNKRKKINDQQQASENEQLMIARDVRVRTQAASHKRTTNDREQVFIMIVVLVGFKTGGITNSTTNSSRAPSAVYR